MENVRIGVVGCGYWGPNHIRNFSALRSEGAEMAMAADLDAGRRRHIEELYPSVKVVADAHALIDNPEIDAVVIATPPSTHYPLAKRALENGKHVLVEKPYVLDVAEAVELGALAEERELALAVGHIFEYSAAVNRIRELIIGGELGNVLYVRSLRVNLGLFQKNINVMWDLAPHDVSILRYVLGRTPTAVHAVGKAHVNPGAADVVNLTLEFGDLLATVIVSWLDPRKTREMTFVGDRKMLVYDDLSASEKIKIYDKGVDVPQYYDSFGEFQFSYRHGDTLSPAIDEYEPMREQCMHFLDSIKFGKQPRAGAEAALDVTRVLVAAQMSLDDNGRRVELEEVDVATGGRAVVR
jgi:predicted dehydrogenase